MQVGIDVGATKIESVVLEEDGQEKHRSRISCPKDYTQIVTAIRDIHKKLEQEFKKELPIGVCHPGVHSPQTGLVKNAPNITWLEKKPFQNDLRKALGKEVFCENDANCFALSEAIDGSGKHYKIVYGIILGSGVGYYAFERYSMSHVYEVFTLSLVIYFSIMYTKSNSNILVGTDSVPTKIFKFDLSSPLFKSGNEKLNIPYNEILGIWTAGFHLHFWSILVNFG